MFAVKPVPDMLPSVQVDRGAIKFVLSGANVMSPGLTSAGGKLPDPSKGETPIKKGQCVAIRAQGKDEILAVGVMQMDTEEVRKTGKGIAIENIHYLGGEFQRQAAICQDLRDLSCQRFTYSCSPFYPLVLPPAALVSTFGRCPSTAAAQQTTCG